MLRKLRFSFFLPLCSNQTCTLVFLVVISEESCRVSDVVNKRYFQSNSISIWQVKVRTPHTNKEAWETEKGCANERCSRRYHGKPVCGGQKTNNLQYFMLFSITVVVSSLWTKTIKEMDQISALKLAFFHVSDRPRLSQADVRDGRQVSASCQSLQ